MRALIFGDLHGRIRSMYRCAAEWERHSGAPVEVLLQVGDFGIYPDPSTPERNEIERFGDGDYASLLAEGWSAPVPTYFCKGNNEDFEALSRNLAAGLTCVPDGEVILFGATRVAFLGGCWAPKSFASAVPSPNHIGRAEVDRLRAAEFDLLICHEAPAGTRLPNHIYAVGAPPLRDLIIEKKPLLVAHGHHHVYTERMIGTTRVVGLDLLPAEGPPGGAILPVEL